MQRGIDRLSIVCFALVLLALSVFAVVNRDIGFHLRAGELIWLQGEIPTHDVFSYIAEGRRWLDSHWLFQLLLHGAHAAGGAPGLVTLRVLLVGAAFGMLLAASHRPGRLPVALGLGLLVVFVSYQRFILRPELVSIVFLAAFVLGAERFHRNPKFWLFVLPGLELIWVNSHGLHVLGPIYLGLRLVGDLFQGRARGFLPQLAAPRPDPRELRQRGFLLALCTLGLLVNANGIEGIVYPYWLFYELQGQVGWFPPVVELRSPLALAMPRSLFDPIVFYWVFVLLSGVVLARRWRQLQLSDLLPYLAFFLLSLAARRNAPLFAVVAMPIVARCLSVDRRPGSTAEIARRSRRPAILTFVSMLAVTAVVWLGVVSNGLYQTNGWLRRFGVGESRFYPSGILPRLRQLEGRFLNEPNMGGYLIWKLYPQHQVALDGRWEVYRELTPHVVEAFRDSERLGALVEEYDIRAVALFARPGNQRMIRRLKRNPDFRLALRTRNAVLFERAGAREK